jgi:1-aminocyclopropane-1-carboxylate deaminase/D-cysteine desulfhydrase-like pyridoxal-dependent ACC family enzyme
VAAPTPIALPDLPRFPLFDGPSPLQRAPRFVEALGGGFELWIKREDLLPLGFGGNKLRNLEFLVGEALAARADVLVTSGRRWSNHARLTAAAGARAGLEVQLVLSGPPAPGGESANARIERLLGATVHQLPTADRVARDERIERVVTDLFADGRRPYLIPVGGSSATGAFGQVLAGLELVSQLESDGGPPDLVILPSATGGTQAGLLVALGSARVRSQVVGVVVARPAEELAPAIAATATKVAGLLGVEPPAVDEICLDESQLGLGYGVPTEAADEAAHLLGRTEAILVDPIYTAKALAGLVAMARAGELAGRRVVFWHAGGIPGLFEPLDVPSRSAEGVG